jgi:ABC-type Mn2+/Zn2+ transport system ATPase subunit
MLDEIFDALDKNGRQMVGQVLSTLAKNVDKVFVITHTDIATGLSLAGVITAEKQENIEDGTTQSVITVTQM